MSLSRSLLVITAAALLAAGVARGQDPAPEPAPSPAPTPEAPGDAPQSKGDAEVAEVKVEYPEEIARIQVSLDRLAKVRRDLERGSSEELRAGKVFFDESERSPRLGERSAVLPLTLEDAVKSALANNPDYLVALLDARAAAEGIPQARAAFDPTVNFTGTWAQNRSPFFSNNPFSGLPPGLAVSSSRRLNLQTTVSQLFPTGTQLSLSYNEARTKSNNAFALNPSYTPSLQASITQPLLRGFGLDVNLAALRNARSTARQSEATLVETYMNAAVTVEQAYWNLIVTEEQLRSQKRSLESAIKLLEDTRKLRKWGRASRLDVTVAKSGVATRREGLIVAESNLEAANDQMVRLVRPTGDVSKWDMLVVAVDLPQLTAEPSLDPAASVQQALNRRPDYYRAQLALENARRDMTVAENNALPALNLIGTWSQQGLGGQHHSSWSALGSGRFYTWSAGLSVDLPIMLRSERAAVRQRKILIERAEVSLRSVEANVVLDVRGSIRDIRTSKARIEAARAARILSKQRLEATRARVETGAAVRRDVLLDLAALAGAETGEVQAYVNYRLAITRLRRATGTLLDGSLSVLDDRVRKVLERRE
ncbi:MAG: TolC family protein [Planctomycetes bacterium]|nr:TolC family protein [Planctomycetota bacterium]